MGQTAAVAVADCLFCNVVNGSTPAHLVLDDDVATAFLDRSPLFKGHVLVVPRVHVVTLADLPPGEVGPLFERVRRIGAVMPEALDCHGSFMAVNNTVSQSVAHLHVHVVPRRRKDGLRGFFWPRTRYADDAEAESYADRLRSALAGSGSAGSGLAGSGSAGSGSAGRAEPSSAHDPHR